MRPAMKRMKRVPSMPAPTSQHVVPSLRYWRLERLLTQRQLAEMSGVSEPTVTRAEGGSKVGALTAARLARALDVSVTALRAAPPEEE
jgi:transcriptional regulator with XRE-family HTH domain